MLFHLNSVSKDHVQVEHQILDLTSLRSDTLVKVNTFQQLRVRRSTEAVSYLLREGSIAKVHILFGVGQDGLERASQVLLIEVL